MRRSPLLMWSPAACWEPGLPFFETTGPIQICSHGKLEELGKNKKRKKALSLWSGNTDSKTLDYQRTNPAAAATAAKSLQSCPILCDPIDGSPPGSPVPGGKNTRVGCHALFQVIFLTQGSNPDLLHAGRFFTTVPQGQSRPWMSLP